METSRGDIGLAWKANTSNAALVAGSDNPAEKSAASVASMIDSMTRDSRMEIASTPGQSMTDAQPEKRTQQERLFDAGGGGRRVVDLPVTADDSQRELRASPDMAQLNAAIGAETLAQFSPTANEGGATADSSGDSIALDRGTLSRERDKSNPDAVGFEVLGETNGTESATTRRSSQTRTDLAGLDPDDDEKGEQMRKVSSDSRFSTASRIAAVVDAGTGRVPGSNESAADSLTVQRSGEGAEDVKVSDRLANLSDGSSEAREIASRRSSVDGGSRQDSRADLSSPASDRRSNSSEGRTETGRVAEVRLPAPGAGESSGEGESIVSGRIGPSMKLELAAETGPAGMDDAPSMSLGSPLRPANRDSLSLQPDQEARFLRESSGMPSRPSFIAPLATEAFQSRNPVGKSSAPSTEVAIEQGLEFLARYQNPDGSWSLEIFDQSHPSHASQITSTTAATGLAVLAFQGAGYHHRDFRYARQIEKALQWMMMNQKQDGNLYVPADARSNSSAQLYSHAIATLALTEAYGMTRDPGLREPCQRAIQFIAETQDTRLGGWQYQSEPVARSTDTSVTGWMAMALQSARYGGFEVPESVFDRIRGWLEIAQEPGDPSRYRYNPYAEDSVQYREMRMRQRMASPSMTAVGLLMQVYLGEGKDSPLFDSGIDYLMSYPPDNDTIGNRNTYYWYYATQVLRHRGGEPWLRWNGAMHAILVNSQVKTGEYAGSWNPYDPIPDVYGSIGGRLYVTTMNLLSLEVDYRLLPLYEQSTPETR